MRGIRAIVFDAYGTLFDIATIDDRLQQVFGEKAAAIASTWRQKQLEYSWLSGMMKRYKPFSSLTRDALGYACKRHNAALTDTRADDLMQRYNQLEIYPEVESALKSMQGLCQLAILSNADAPLLRAAIRYNRIDPYFEGVFSVDEIERFKPDPAVYELPAKGLGRKKEELLFVSSNTWDTAGAKSAGLRVCWANRSDGMQEELGLPADIRVADLEELAGEILP
ncbi:MAG: haloacid dehalogenase type II [Saprospiraceae bacterium]|nr:haloacid dehalogenase type II [Saprospiraceae bacterium]